jgi:hypothetical protein
MLAAILAAAIAGFPPGEVSPPPSQTVVAPRAAKEKIPESIWRDAEGPVAEHLQTGLRCPDKMGDFRRVHAMNFDGFGLDVSCGYNSDVSVVTLYLTLMGDLEGSFGHAKASIAEHLGTRGLRPVSEGRVEAGGLTWLRAEFTFDGYMRSDLWMADMDGWILKFRASYPDRAAASVAAEIEALMTGATETAGARLALCGKSSRPARAARAVKVRGDSASIGLMGAVLGGAAASLADEEGEGESADITYCVEEAVTQKDKGFLIWRGVTPDGGDARADRLSAMTMGPPPTLDLEADSLSSLIAAKVGPDGPQRWMATMRDGRQVDIYGYFEGRPPPKALIPVLTRILDGKTKPIGGYSVDGKTITVSAPDR